MTSPPFVIKRSKKRRPSGSRRIREGSSSSISMEQRVIAGPFGTCCRPWLFERKPFMGACIQGDRAIELAGTLARIETPLRGVRG